MKTHPATKIGLTAVFEVIPQAPRYEMNARGVLRNRETGYILKWSLSPKGTKTTSLTYAGKKITVTLPHLMWQLHGKIISKKRPVPVVISKGTRSMRFDSLRQCARFLEEVAQLTFWGAWFHLVKRRTSVADWHIHYCY